MTKKKAGKKAAKKINTKKHGSIKRSKLRKTSKKVGTKRRDVFRKSDSKRKGSKKVVAKAAKVVKKGKKRSRKTIKVVKIPKRIGVKHRSKKTTTSKSRIKKVSTKRRRYTKTIGDLQTRRITSKDYRNNRSFFLSMDLKDFKTFKQKIDAIRNWSGNGVQYFLDKFEKFPRAFMVILVTMKRGKGNEPYERANVLSPPDMSVNVDNIKKLILEYMVAFQDNFMEYIQDDIGDSDWVYDPKQIIAVNIRFFYAPEN